MTRQCYVSSYQQVVPDPEFPSKKEWKMVEDREFIWQFHGWGIDYQEFEAGPGQFSVAIIEAECGKVAMVRADQIRFLPDTIEKGE